MAETVALKIITLRSPSMASPSYNISSNVPFGSKVVGVWPYRQAGDLISLLLLLGK
jgi:hypothetical protein